jgi:D-alanyl-D-alanine carboxypeptidase
MNSKYIFITLTAALLLIACKSNIGKINGKHKAAKADDYSFRIDSLVLAKTSRNFNGVVHITQKGKTKYSKAFGYSDLEQKKPLTINDNFRIQSNTKQITAAMQDTMKKIRKTLIKP